MIILFGPAGSGKGTQGQALARIFGWRWISNGEVIRNSHKYDELTRRGELIPDQDVIEMMNEEVRKAQEEGLDIVFDGYPRDEVQARYLMQHMADQIRGAIVLEVPKEELYQRLALRGRDDDQSREAIDRRFGVFEQNFVPIARLLEAHEIPVRRVDGTGTPEEVTERLVAIVKELVPEARKLASETEESAPKAGSSMTEVEELAPEAAELMPEIEELRTEVGAASKKEGREGKHGGDD